MEHKSDNQIKTIASTYGILSRQLEHIYLVPNKLYKNIFQYDDITDTNLFK